MRIREKTNTWRANEKSAGQTDSNYVIKFWEPSNVLILSNYKIVLVIPDRTCINFDHMVYYMYELRWASSDNT